MSAIAGKYNFQGKQKLKRKIRTLFFSNTSIVAIALTTLSLLEITGFSRLIVFGTVGIASIIEFFTILPFIIYQKSNREFFYEGSHRAHRDIILDRKKGQSIQQQFSSSVKEGITRIAGLKVFNFLEKHIPVKEEDIFFTATRRSFNIENKTGQHQAIVNLQSLNTVTDLNRIFNATNKALPLGGLYFSISETIVTRKKNIKEKYPILINNIIYIFDYFIHRFFAKIYPFRLIYNNINHKNRALSKAELLGRLYASGFEVVDERIIDGTFVCIARKTGEPKVIDYEAIGGLIRLKRLGKNGKIIGVYKFRTMHAYSEFIQEYVYQKNDLKEGGKFNEDFRVNTLGKYLRRSWIDELPMFINFFKGEMKLVGVRPLSEHFFSLYTKELQDLRITTKPGLLPPFYADSPVTLEEIMDSELRYLKAYKKHPIKTDIQYFFKILNNILIKRRRSQ